MGREEAKLSEAKRSYRSAKATGSHEEEARWANVIGNMLMDRADYLQACNWFHIDYDISTNYLSPRHCLDTCQSLGQVYLRLERFQDALVFQKKHLMLAEEANDLVEQQRANTQLGRTYHDMFRKSLEQHQSMQNAKKYFMSAMKLAQTIMENPPTNKSSFIKEYIDAYNNIGLLELDLENLEEAEKIFTKALDICDQEEINEYDDVRTRFHHNLGKVYTELRIWDKAREHIERDIIICEKFGHCEGEAKGYINLGQLQNRVQKYQEALLCYRKALDLAKSMEDEDALVRQIVDNIKTVKRLGKVMNDMKRREQNLNKLTTDMTIARVTPHERNWQLQQNASLDCLIDRSKTISAWPKDPESDLPDHIDAQSSSSSPQQRSSALTPSTDYSSGSIGKTWFSWFRWPSRSNDDSPAPCSASPKHSNHHWLRWFRKSPKKVKEDSVKTFDGDGEKLQLLGNLEADEEEEFFTPDPSPGEAPAYNDHIEVVIPSNEQQALMQLNNHDQVAQGSTKIIEIVGWIWLAFHLIFECILAFFELYGIGNPRMMLTGAILSAVAAYLWISEIVGMHCGRPFSFWRLPFVPEIFGLVVVFVQLTYFVMAYESLIHHSEEKVTGPIIRICIYSLSLQICLFLQKLGHRFG